MRSHLRSSNKSLVRGLLFQEVNKFLKIFKVAHVVLKVILINAYFFCNFYMKLRNSTS